MDNVESFHQAFAHWVKRTPDRIALVARRRNDSDWQSYTWQQLDALVGEYVSFLGDAPTILAGPCHNTVDDVVESLAANRLGWAESPIDHRVPPEETQRRIARLNRFRKRLLDSPTVVLWTTGTGGTSKGVRLSRAAILANAKAKLAAVPQQTDDIRLTVLPISHAFARTCDMGTWILSGCRWTLTLGYDEMLQLLPNTCPTTINVVPTLARRLMHESPPGLNRLRILGVGGAALDPATFRYWQASGVTVIQGYGLTETGPTVLSATPNDARVDRVGKAVAGWETKIVDRQLFVRGPSLADGYVDSGWPTITDPHGWFATGDVVQIDSDGQHQILGRQDDALVLANGALIDPLLIERELDLIVGVRHSLVRVNDLGEVEIWIDGKLPPATSVKQQLDRHRCLGNYSVHAFEPPLDLNAGELTAKGVICRHLIQERRFR